MYFPVPDGDTGTNMTMTIMSAAKEVRALTDPAMAELAKAISSGSLRGARGNSGVILSQLFEDLQGYQRNKEIDVTMHLRRHARRRETAYKAVMKPKEGTILTVAKGLQQKGSGACRETEDVGYFFPKRLSSMQRMLDQTPEMLPVLKKQVLWIPADRDSGSITGAYDAFMAKRLIIQVKRTNRCKLCKISAETEADIKFGYCTEFIIVLNKQFTQRR